jgi:serine/threonine protein kinase
MGTVWRADDVLLGRPVAVKEVELPAGPPGAEREALRERALREARAVARLNHPGVVTLHDAVEADDRLFLVMELVDAPTLRDLVDRSGPVGHWAAARVGLELLDALDAAHRAGIVHHDVKPANVMVAASGRVKLADFGIASLQGDTQRTLTGAMSGRGDGRAVTAVFGSLPYVAPEQASGGHAGPAAGTPGRRPICGRSGRPCGSRSRAWPRSSGPARPPPSRPSSTTRPATRPGPAPSSPSCSPCWPGTRPTVPRPHSFAACSSPWPAAPPPCGQPSPANRPFHYAPPPGDPRREGRVLACPPGDPAPDRAGPPRPRAGGVLGGQ